MVLPIARINDIYSKLDELEKDYITNKEIYDINKNIGYFYRIGEKVYKIEKEIFKAAKRSFENKNKDKIGINLKAACSIFQELSKSKSYEIYLKANYCLGCCYENGIGYYKNESLALYHFELASNAGSIYAKNKLKDKRKFGSKLIIV
ncbi:7441_t:CDS:1 [Gigaspora margarita]|uniref:7441_t:CDS:1 n=1 Tax=Gigaspora margarita TaxID=4874 RepID=A0ABN7WF64_GIGMA|nr:7441_t:CDS:1 [Gigaspora margarita]